MSNSLSLEGKVAHVTGSTRGIGWTVACALAEHGAAVVLNGHSNAEQLERRVAELKAKAGGEVAGLLYDVADPSQIAGAYQEIFKKFKRLDILVNNAGVLGDALVGMISDSLIQRTFAVNTQGAILGLQAAARLMMRSKTGGSIVNVSSIVGIQGNEGQAVYSASKAALVGLTLSAARELAPKGIRVNAVAPGFIETDMIKHLSADTHAQRLASIKMGRVGEPDDIANAVLFFASDLSSYVTGQVLGVDGGMII